MLDTELLSSIAKQMIARSVVELDGKRLSVRRTSAHHLKTAVFTMDGREYRAIEQNPDKLSRWGQLAKSGHQVVQFKDSETNRFVAVAVDGKVRVYGQIKKPETPSLGNTGWALFSTEGLFSHQEISECAQRSLHIGNRILDRIQVILEGYRHFRQGPSMLVV